MGLFSIFDAHDSEDSARSSGDKPSLSLDLPCVVQLYRSRPVRLEAAAGGHPAAGGGGAPPYAMLSYSAVSLGGAGSEGAAAADSNAPPGSPTKKSAKKPLLAAAAAAPAPELGVWSVCVPRPGSDALLLLPPRPAPSAFCLAVDLSDPRQVEPTLSSLQDALVRYLIARPLPPSTRATDDEAGAARQGNKEDEEEGGDNEDHNNTSATPATAKATSLYDLRTVSFGLAAEDADSAGKLSGSRPAAGADADDKDRGVRVALVICARRSPPVAKNDYRARQAQALLYYHLRRYASALHAALCFVDEGGRADSLVDDDDGDDPNDQPAVDAAQLTYIFRELAAGRPLNLAAPELKTLEGSAFAFAYTAANHNPELIESALLRNAHYPGEWDAAKESLWKALPPPPSEPGTAHSSAPDDAPAFLAAPPEGDSPWLTELRDSVAASATDVAKTPAKAARKEVTPDSAQKDAAVSSFFESLLK